MSATTKLKWKKITTQLRYLYSELDIVKTISNEAAVEFQEYYENYCLKKNIDRKSLNKQHEDRISKLYSKKKEDKEEPRQIEHSDSTALVSANKPENKKEQADVNNIQEPPLDAGDDKELYDVFSKLFRKLATVLHPDKLNNSDYSDEKKQEMSSMFTEAKNALEQKRYFILIDYAEQLDVPIPKNYRQQIRWMKKELDKVRAEIAAVTRTYNYSFSETETDEQRDQLIEKFMRQVFGNISSNNQ